MLNCKQGDLAIVVKSQNGRNFGKIVQCITYVGKVEGKKPNDIWVVDQMIQWTDNNTGEVVNFPMISDSNLRPLRGDISDDETDEMILITGKPEQLSQELEV